MSANPYEPPQTEPEVVPCMEKRWIVRINQCGHWYAFRLRLNEKVAEYVHPDKLRPNIANEQNTPTGLFKTKKDAAQAAWDLDLELKGRG